MKLTDLLTNAIKATKELRKLAKEHPDWEVERNDVGNLAIIDVKENTYQGYVDFLHGEVDLWEEEG